MRPTKTAILIILLFCISCIAQINIKNDINIETSLKGIAKVKKLNEIASYYDNKGVYDSARLYFNKSLRYSQDNNYQEEIGRAYYNLGRIYDTEGEYDLAVKNYSLAVETYSKANIKKGVAEGLTGIATMERLSGQYNKSYNDLMKALSISNELQDSSLIAFVKYRLGIFYIKVNNYDKSIPLFRALLKFYKSKNDLKRISACYNYLGIVYAQNKDYDSAMLHYKKALEIRKGLNDLAGIGTSLNVIGDVEFEQGNLKTALNSYYKSDSIRAKINIKYGIAETQKNIGKVYVKLGQPKQALPFLLRSIELCKKANLPEILKTDYYYLSLAYRQLKDYKNTLEYLDLYTNLNDSISVDDFNKKLSNIKYEFEIDRQNAEINNLKKEQELINKNSRYKNFVFISVIVLLILIVAFIFYRFKVLKRTQAMLEEKNIEIMNKEKSLVELNAAKDKLFRIIGHDLKNPFHNLLGLSEILIQDFAELTDEEKIDYLNGIRSSSKKSYQLLENLLQWAKSQMEKPVPIFTKVNVYEIAEQSIGLLKISADRKNISIANNLEKSVNCLSDYNYLYTIFRNLISNSIKYTNKGGSILIDCKDEGGFLTFLVKDDGIGMSDGVRENLFKFQADSRPGTENERGTGLGLILCKELLESLNSKLEIESKAGSGSTFSFRIKK